MKNQKHPIAMPGIMLTAAIPHEIYLRIGKEINSSIDTIIQQMRSTNDPCVIKIRIMQITSSVKQIEIIDDGTICELSHDFSYGPALTAGFKINSLINNVNATAILIDNKLACFEKISRIV